MFLRFFIFISIFSVTIIADAQELNDILNNLNEASGGKEKWENLQSMKVTGTITAAQGKYQFTNYIKRPNKIYTEVNVQGQKIIPQAFDGETGWSINPFTGSSEPQDLSEKHIQMLKNEVHIEPEYLNYEEKGHNITYEGMEEIQGVNCYKLNVIKNTGSDELKKPETHYVNAETYLPYMIRTSISFGPFQGSDAEKYFKDYQEIDYGILIPYHIETRVNENVIEEINYQEVTANIDVEDSLFEPQEK